MAKKFSALYSITIHTRTVASSALYTANVYRGLQGLYGEIGVRGFQIYGDCMYTRNPVIFKSPHFGNKEKLLQNHTYPHSMCAKILSSMLCIDQARRVKHNG